MEERGGGEYRGPELSDCNLSCKGGFSAVGLILCPSVVGENGGCGIFHLFRENIMVDRREVFLQSVGARGESTRTQ